MSGLFVQDQEELSKEVYEILKKRYQPQEKAADHDHRITVGVPIGGGKDSAFYVESSVPLGLKIKKFWSKIWDI